MTGLASVDGGPATHDPEDLEALEARLRGPLLRPGSEDHEAARRLWNAQIDRRPVAIVRATGAADVMETVRFARERGLLMSVKGNGHQVGGLALADGALCLDLSAMRGIHADPVSRTARVQPGCNWGDVDREGQVHGLAVPSGIVSTTGVAGLTLGGGFGWTTRKYGLTSDNLLSADLVLADGRLVRASADENPDLFWAIRGGGGNFGVVTSFEFRMQPVGPQVVAGMVLHRLDDAREVADLFRQVTEAADDDLTCILLMRKAPPAPFLPAEIHGAPVAGILVCHAGSIADGERAAAAIKAFGEPLADLIGPKPFTAHQTMLDAAQPYGRRYYWKSDYFDRLTDEMAAVMIDHVESLTSPHSSILFMHLGGAAARLPVDHSAAGHRSARYVLNVNASWDTPPDEEHIAWARSLWQGLQPYSNGGVYMNFLSEDDMATRTDAAYGSAMERLRRVKADYDPDNFFRVNQNIVPA